MVITTESRSREAVVLFVQNEWLLSSADENKQ